MSLGPYHDELYEQVLPMHGPDSDGFAQDYVGACVYGVIEVDELVRDTEAGPGWGVILDVDDAPIKGLRWLAQLAGVKLRPPKLLAPPVNMIRTPIPSAGVSGATADSAGIVNAQLSGTGAYGPYIVAGEETNFNELHVAWNCDPTSGQEIYGGADAATVAPFGQYTFAITILETSHTVFASIVWADVDGIVISEIDDGVVDDSAGRRIVQGTAPDGAVNAWPVVTLQTVDGLGSYFLAEGPVFEAGWTSGVFYTADTAVARLETPEEWAVYARSALREQNQKFRGTQRAMRDAVRDTLAGTDPYVDILERVGGNAYALTLVTRPSETPDPDATYAAALTQKPLGMALTHTLSEGVLIDEGTKTIDAAGGTIDMATLADVAD